MTIQNIFPNSKRDFFLFDFRIRRNNKRVNSNEELKLNLFSSETKIQFYEIKLYKVFS